MHEILRLHENLQEDETLIIYSLVGVDTTVSSNDFLIAKNNVLVIRRQNGAVTVLNPDWIIKCRTYGGILL